MNGNNYWRDCLNDLRARALAMDHKDWCIFGLLVLCVYLLLAVWRRCRYHRQLERLVLRQSNHISDLACRSLDRLRGIQGEALEQMRYTQVTALEQITRIVRSCLDRDDDEEHG